MGVLAFIELQLRLAVIHPVQTVLLHTSPVGGKPASVLLGGVLVLGGAIYSWRMSSMSGPQTIWIGIAIEIAGFGGDAYWHSIHGSEEVGLIPPAHWLIILGAVVALIGALRTWQNTDGAVAYAAAVASIPASAQVVGAVWDNLLHYAGIEPAPTALPHLLKSLGLVLLFLSAVVVGGIEWRVKTVTSTERR